MKTIVILTLLSALSACGGSQRRGSMPPDPLKNVAAPKLYATGLALNARQDFVRAEQYFVAAMAKGMSEKKVMPDLLRACVLSMRLRSAIQHGEGYALRFPEDLEVRVLLAAIYHGLGEQAKAREHLLRVVEVDAQRAEAIFLLARVQSARGEPDEARKWFSAYLDLVPEGARAPEAREQLARIPDVKEVPK